MYCEVVVIYISWSSLLWFCLQVKKTINKDEFRLRHYAGEVAYRVQGFLDKNNDLLFRDLKEVMTHTANMIITDVFPKVRNCSVD